MPPNGFRFQDISELSSLNCSPQTLDIFSATSEERFPPRLVQIRYGQKILGGKWCPGKARLSNQIPALQAFPAGDVHLFQRRICIKTAKSFSQTTTCRITHRRDYNMLLLVLYLSFSYMFSSRRNHWVFSTNISDSRIWPMRRSNSEVYRSASRSKHQEYSFSKLVFIRSWG